MPRILIYPLLLFLIACVPANPALDTESIVASYYQTYQERSNFQQFLNFYADTIVLKDMINGDHIEGKTALEAFFDWENPHFRKLDSVTLVVQEQIMEGKRVVTQGYFTPFQWDEYQFEAMHFTTILTFNDNGKIVEQVDWINYPTNLVDYENRKNSNEWINK